MLEGLTCCENAVTYENHCAGAEAETGASVGAAAAGL